MATLIYRIGDITCIGCINRITKSLKSIGAVDVDIDFSTHIAKVLTEENDPNWNIYLQAIVQTGYQVEYLATINED